MNTERILITGGTGFIGRSLIKSLEGNELHIITRQNLLSTNNRVYHRGDISEIDTFRKIENMEFTKVFHLAWSGLPDRSTENCEINFNATKKFLDILKKISFKKLIAVGSCLELEDATSIFAKTKQRILHEISKMQIDFIWPRIFYAYGPGQHRNSLLNQLVEKILQKQKFNLINPEISHDFIFIEDVIEGLKKAGESQFIGQLDLGSGESTSVGRFAQTVFDIFGIDSTIGISPSRDGIVADVVKTKIQIQWQARFDLEAGIRKAILDKGVEI